VGHALIVPKSEHAPNDCTPYSVRVPAALAFATIATAERPLPILTSRSWRAWNTSGTHT